MNPSSGNHTKALRRGLFLIALAGMAAALLLWYIALPDAAGIFLILSIASLALGCSFSPSLQSLSFTLWVLAVACLALLHPDRLTHAGGYPLKNLITPLIQVIMFGMGITLTMDDFRRVLQMPAAIALGAALQYGIMPISGWICATIFDLPPEIAVGLILVGSCPGGTASNVITYIAGANVPLSVTMTACSTLISPLATPLAMKLLVGQIIPVAFFPLMVSILEMILIPVVAGILINRYFPAASQVAARILPAICMAAICLIIGITIALSSEDLRRSGITLFFAAVCHNGLGFGLGYSLARLCGMNRVNAKTMSIEVGMQNCGMATGLAFGVLKSTAAALPSAVFGPWSALAGSVLASWWRSRTRSSRT